MKAGETVAKGTRADGLSRRRKMVAHHPGPRIAGRVAEVRFAPGDQVQEGDQLIAFEVEKE